MIIKFYEISKVDLNQNKLVLLYGKNEGLKNEAINNLIKNKKEISTFEEKEILDNIDKFIEKAE